MVLYPIVKTIGMVLYPIFKKTHVHVNCIYGPNLFIHRFKNDSLCLSFLFTILFETPTTQLQSP